MRFWVVVVALTLSSAMFMGCDGDGPTNRTNTTTTVATTTVPASANIDVEILSFAAVSSGQGNLFQVEIRMTESGSAGANINFARLEVFRATGELEERQEIGADQIIAGVGDNRLEANATEEATLTFFFRATVKKGVSCASRWALRTIPATITRRSMTSSSLDRL